MALHNHGMRFARGKKRVEHVLIYAIVPDDLEDARNHPLLSAELPKKKIVISITIFWAIEEKIGFAHLADLELRRFLNIGIMIEG